MQKLLTATILYSLAIVISRLSGLARDLSVANSMGTSRKSDLVLILISLPDLLISLTLIGGLTGVLVPTLAKIAHQEAEHLFATFLKKVMPPAGFLILILIIFPEFIIYCLAPGTLEIDLSDQELLGLRLALLSSPIILLSTIYGARLQSQKRAFFVPLSAAIFNGVIIIFLLVIGIVTIASDQLLTLVGVCVICAATLRFIFTRNLIKTDTETLRDKNHRGLNKEFWTNMVKASLSVAILVFTPLLFRSVYSLAGPGALSEFIFAQRIIDVPVALLASAISVTLMPYLAETANRSSQSEHDQLCSTAMWCTLVAGLLVSAITMLNSQLIVELVFSSEANSIDTIHSIKRLLHIMSFSIPGMFLQILLISILNSRDLSQEVLKSMVLSVIITLPCFLVPNTEVQGALLAFVVQPSVAAILMLLAAGKRGNLLKNRLGKLIGIVAAWAIVMMLDTQYIKPLEISIGFKIIANIITCLFFVGICRKEIAKLLKLTGASKQL